MDQLRNRFQDRQKTGNQMCRFCGSVFAGFVGSCCSVLKGNGRNRRRKKERKKQRKWKKVEDGGGGSGGRIGDGSMIIGCGRFVSL